jgi:OOP family OmpA-OmpF porin
MKNLIYLFVFFFCLSFINLNAQSNIGGKVKNQTTNRVDNKVDQGIDGGLDAVGNGVKNIFKKKKNNNVVQQEEEVTVEQPQEKNQEVEKVINPAPGTQPTLAAYSKYDFIPGAKVIFYDDFTEAAVGDFPSNWNTNASGEVVTTNLFPGKWFKMIGEGSISLNEGMKLPDNYTIEFEVIPQPSVANDNGFDFGFYLYSAENPKDLNEGGAVPGLKGGIKMTYGYRAAYDAYDETGYTINGIKEDAVMEPGKKYRISFWVQKTRLRVYLDETKVFDLPRVFKAGMQCNMLRFELWNSGAPLITNFRVAAGLPDTRNKLMTEGKMVTYGIYFDVNSDKVKPESYGTLKDIAAVLNEVPDVKVKIFGHTDSDGDDAKNLDLSKRRAASVKAELSKSFGVNASRLETDGLGETKPVAANDTPVNKALNRRVEFIKL